MGSESRCCPGEHPFDSRGVAERWWPGTLRCLIIGESPGGPGDAYFYDPPQPGAGDPVRVRVRLLDGLTRVGLIVAPTLHAFREGGFLFDHAIRCQLPDELIEREWRRAKTYRSIRAAAGVEHLRPALAVAQRVWVMGYIARNAMAMVDSAVLEQQRITPPYLPRGNPRLFVSRYVSRASHREMKVIMGMAAKWMGHAAPRGGSSAAGHSR